MRRKTLKDAAIKRTGYSHQKKFPVGITPSRVDGSQLAVLIEKDIHFCEGHHIRE